MGRRKKKSLRGSLEISVEEASLRLGVCPRTINNYIQEKKLKAVKVAGQWFIDAVSVDALAQSYDLRPRPIEKKIPSSVMSGVPSAKPVDSSTGSKEDAQKINSPNKFGQGPANEKQKGPNRLAVYRLAREAFSMPGWKNLSRALPMSSVAIVLNHQMKIYALLGSGYYLWGPEKLILYRRAQSGVGAILGILYSTNECADTMKPELHFLERRLLPAFTALLFRLNSSRPRHRRTKANVASKNSPEATQGK